LSLFILFKSQFFKVNSEDFKDEKKLADRLKESYRVTIYDIEDHSEVSSFLTTRGKFYFYTSLLTALIIILTCCLIIFTPIKKLIPGYGDILQNDKYIELNKKLDQLELDIENQAVYNAGLQKLLTAAETNDSNDNRKESDKSDNKNQTLEKSKNYITTNEVEESNEARELNQLVFTPPVKGIVSAEFDLKKNHYGIDILSTKNTPIIAALPGVVINADWSVDTGNTIYIQHAKNIVTSYKHNSALLVSEGDQVKAGQAIAIIGNTGKLTNGPHLHFELWFDGQAVNPMNFINFN